MNIALFTSRYRQSLRKPEIIATYYLFEVHNYITLISIRITLSTLVEMENTIQYLKM